MSFFAFGLTAAAAALFSLPAQFPTSLPDSIPKVVQKDMSLSADSLVARHIRALGGIEAIKAVNSVHELRRWRNEKPDEYWTEIGKRFRGITPTKHLGMSGIMQDFAMLNAGFAYFCPDNEPAKPYILYAHYYGDSSPYVGILSGCGYYSKLKFWAAYTYDQLNAVRVDDVKDSTYNLKIEIDKHQFLLLMLDPGDYVAYRAEIWYQDKPNNKTNCLETQEYSSFRKTLFGLSYACRLKGKLAGGGQYEGEILDFNFSGKDEIFKVPYPELVQQRNSRSSPKNQFSISDYEHPVEK